MTGYFINVKNYLPCPHCKVGFDRTEMLCIKPYYYHMPRTILKAKPMMTGITAV